MDARVASPWHAGETALQGRAGVAARMAEVGRRTVRDHLIPQHREFYPLLPFIVAGVVDPAGDAWATVIAGAPGFVRAPDPQTLAVSAPRDPSDPADAGMADGDAIGLLGIELTTRRRNRANGIIRRRGEDEFRVAVAQSFGNCPRYIHVREAAVARPSGETETLTTLDEAARAAIRSADTFFVASYVDREDGRRQVDVSHRGGAAGFVHVSEDGTLTIPDYAGNLHFATLGNILLNPRAGLAFVDFTSGAMLQLSGTAELVADPADLGGFPGAERLWRFRARRIVRRPGALHPSSSGI